MSFVLWCRTFCGWLNGSWLCLHGFAIWQQKGKNGAGERFVLEIRTSPSELMAARSWQSHSLAIKSLRFHQNIHVRQSEGFKHGRNLWKKMKWAFCCAARGRTARALRALRRRCCVWLLSIKGKVSGLIRCFGQFRTHTASYVSRYFPEKAKWAFRRDQGKLESRL